METKKVKKWDGEKIVETEQKSKAIMELETKVKREETSGRYEELIEALISKSESLII